MISRGNFRKALSFAFTTLLILSLILSAFPTVAFATESSMSVSSEGSDEIIVVFNKPDIKTIDVLTDGSNITEPIYEETENTDVSDNTVISDNTDTTEQAIKETTLSEDTEASERRTGSRKRKFSVSKRRSVSRRVDVITPEKDVDTDELIETLSDDPNVLCAGRNFTRELSAIPNDSYYSSQWWYSSVGADKTWNQVNNSNTVVVAVIDTGLNTQHEDMQGRYVQGYDYITNSTNVTDQRGHGTQVSGCIAAVADNSNGIAGVAGTADIKIAPYRVGGINFSDNNLNGAYIVAALYAAADRPEVKIINMSYGGYYGDPYKYTRPSSEEVFKNDPEYMAIKYAANKGKVLVAAAGNEGNKAGYQGAYSYPASYSDVISVAAIANNNSWASFSQYNSEVEICSPGQSITTLSTSDGCTTSSGTSFSSPVVAGCAAVLFAQDPTLTAAEARNILNNTAQNLGDKKYFGNGKVRIDLALATLKKDAGSNLNPASPENPANPVSPEIPASPENPASPEIPAVAGSYQPGKIPANGYKGNRIEVQTMTGAVSQTITSSNKKAIAVNGNILEFVGSGKATVKVTYKPANSGKTKTVSKTIKVTSKATGVSLNTDRATIAKKGKVTLKAYILPSDATNKAVTWVTSNKKVATVTNKGVVTGTGAGTCTITAKTKDGGFIASTAVTVTPIYETAIKLNKSSVSLKQGKTFQLKATLKPSNTDFKAITWSSSNPDIATVTGKGVVKAVNAGTCTITATSVNGKEITCTVTVFP